MLTATTFLLAVLAPLGLAVTAYVLWPLLRANPAGNAHAGDDDVASRLNRHIVLERRAQLDQDLARMPADSPERERLILEFSAAALDDLTPDPSPAMPRLAFLQRRWITAALLAGLLVAGPLAFYRVAGLPDAASPDFAERAGTPSIESLIAELEGRLAADPGAVDGWLMLGRTRLALGELPEALAALEKALTIPTADGALAAQVRVDLADALAQSAGTQLVGRPWRLVQEALARDPSNQKALALAGAYEVSQGRGAEALKYWEPLLAQLPPGSGQHAQISAFVNDVKAGRRPGEAQAAAEAPPSAAAGAPGAAGATDRQPAEGPVLRGRVELAPALAASAAPGDTVFIAVRGVDADGQVAGPPAAALRIRVADLPFDYALSDREAMSPAVRLSGQTRVVVVARVSRSGTAASASGDLEGRSPVVAPDAADVQVRIDRVLP